jgi:putative chitinase
MITFDQFRRMIPTNKEPQVWYDLAVDFFRKYDITTPNRIAGFMAQCAHESRDFMSLEENLNYSVDALLRVFPRYFGPGKRNPAEYARNPQKLANYVYMDEFRTPQGRMGNTRPGDGWRFRGRGIKQLTGRNNYTTFANSVGMTAEEAAEYLSTKKGAFESACWFWKTNDISKFADADDIVGMSRRINGGDIGLQDRTLRYNRAKALLSGSQVQENTQRPASSQFPIRRGSSGETVRRIQQALKIGADGNFGSNTEKAVMSWQRSNKYTVNGIIDEVQFKKITGV